MRLKPRRPSEPELLELHRSSEEVIRLVLGMENVLAIRRLREAVETVSGFYPVHEPAPWAPSIEEIKRPPTENETS